MTSDRWTDRLSEYLDGDLAPDEARELEAHLEGCAECRGVLSDLRRVVEAAHELRDHEPPAELWAGIATRIAREPPDVKVVSLFEAKRARRRVSLSIPQLLAAGLVLALASAGSVWMTLRGGEPGIGTYAAAPVQVVGEAPAGTEADPQPADEGGAPATGAREDSFDGDENGGGEPATGTPGEAGRAARGRDGRPGETPRAGVQEPRSNSGTVRRADPSARLVGYPVDPAYDAAVADLQGVLEAGRDRLDPRTVKVLEESLATIDAAIDDARRALAADPANTDLNTYLQGTMQRKLQLLRDASQIVTATT